MVTVSLAQPHSCLPKVARPRVAQSKGIKAVAFATQPVEEGPGTGKRHYPEGPQRYDLRRVGAAEKHDMMSTEECYKLFPLITHASTPLRIEDSEPAGVSAQRVDDAGPATGRRRRPSPADSPSSSQRQLLPNPGARMDLQRELLARHTPELLLARGKPGQQHSADA